MTNAEKLSFKSNLKNFCLSLIEQRINSSRQKMLYAQLAANEEEKSSAGDKYETSRAMNQRERDMFARQLDANQQELSFASLIDCNKIYITAAPGTVVVSDDTCFFIFAGLGKVRFEEKDVLLISPKAPLMVQLLHKKCGESFQFNNKSVTICDMF